MELHGTKTVFLQPEEFLPGNIKGLLPPGGVAASLRKGHKNSPHPQCNIFPGYHNLIAV